MTFKQKPTGHEGVSPEGIQDKECLDKGNSKCKEFDGQSFFRHFGSKKEGASVVEIASKRIMQEMAGRWSYILYEVYNLMFIYTHT